MAASVLVDASFLVALLKRREADHIWAVAESENYPPPWHTCEAVLSEAFFLLGREAAPALSVLLNRGALVCAFNLSSHLDSVLRLMSKYSDMPMSLADGCLVRMTEILPNPMLLTADNDFRIYRRHGRQMVPCILPR
jgi:predicted nucleic acid-binding protein